MDPHLLITNVIFLIAVVIALGLGIYVLFLNWRKTARYLFSLASLSVIIAIIAHLAGTNAIDAEASRQAFFWTLTLIPAVFFIAHCGLILVNRNFEQRRALVVIYSSGIALVIFFLLFPSTFLLPSVPTGFSPNFYQPGAFYLVFWFYFSLVAFYISYQMLVAYKVADLATKDKIKHFFVLKHFLIFLFLAFLITGVIGLAIFVANSLTESLPTISPFVIYGIFGLVIAGLTMSFFRRAQLADALKYEFIAVVTHKLRAPVTHIKWALNEWSNARQDSDKAKIIGQVESANKRLFELTDVLMGLVKIDADDYQYNFEKRDLASFADNALEGLFLRIKEKGINLVKSYESGLPEVLLDEKRFRFALQVIVENAVNYTKRDGTVEIKLARDSRTASVLISVKDSGIGITKEELPHLFSKFYRAGRARTEDGEGMGIGLYMVRKIVERHNGKVWAESAEINHGATFFIRLPVGV
ncbi:MAG: HAMP domain-containing sensor histidine kinase [Candidatus Paceibacterota bacterium]|jgi:signal transduction histidine kinase